MRKPLEKHETSLRVRRGGKNRAAAGLTMVLGVAAAAVLLALMLFMVAGKMKLTELTQDIQTKQEELSEAQEEYSYMSSKLSSQTNMKTVEEEAEDRLGLVKLDPSQITYFTLDGDSKVEKPEKTAAKLAGLLKAGLDSLVRNLDP